MKPLLYLSADGVLEPLGFSQVFRIVEALGQRGVPYRLVTLERKQNLKRTAAVSELRRRLARAGVTWLALPWEDGGTSRSALVNEGRLIEAALRFARLGSISAIHARAYHGAVAALAAHLATGIAWIFDTRSYWFDERLEEGRWFTTPLRLGVARGLERVLFQRATAIVTLTELQADDVRHGRFGPTAARAIECITTTADFEEFFRASRAECTQVPTAVRERLAGRRVIGLVGSINRSYLIDESLALCRRALTVDPTAHVLVLTAQGEEYERRCAAQGVPSDRLTITRAEHQSMPQWLSLMDWSPLLLQPSSPAKRASMPTKLAEFFACGVAVAQFGGNSEIGDWVRRVEGGVVLTDLSEASTSAAIARLSQPRSGAERTFTRTAAAGHFSHEGSIARYLALARLVTSA